MQCEDDVEEAMGALDKARSDVVGFTADARSGDLVTTVLGGAWLLRQKSKALDVMQSSAKGATAIYFCFRRGCQRSIRFGRL